MTADRSTVDRSGMLRAQGFGATITMDGVITGGAMLGERGTTRRRHDRGRSGSHVRVRLRVCALATAGAVLGAAFGSGSASAGTRPWIMVDRDGRAASGDCTAQTPAYHRVQAAINAARSGDRISVCPGVYAERLRFGAGASGVSIDSEDSFKATIVSPSTGNGPAITIDGAKDVRVRGFRIRAMGRVAPRLIPVLWLAWVEMCEPAPAGILIQNGARATIRGVRIATAPDCGYQVGIEVADSDATIAFDTISDFLSMGIHVGPGSTARILRTDVRFLHVNRKVALPGDGLSGEATGIALDGVASAHISRSGVFSVQPRRSRTNPQLWAGVTIFGARGPVSVWRTRVFRAIRAGYLVTDSPGVTLSDVRVRRNYLDGIYLDDLSGAIVRSGRAANNGRGITLGPGATDVRVIGLRVQNSSVLDCHDSSTGSGSSGTANTWTDVTGDTSDPPGICQPGVAGAEPTAEQAPQPTAEQTAQLTAEQAAE